jgi:hypothetical protein
MKVTEIIPDRACALIAAFLVAVLVVALAVLEALGAETTRGPVLRGEVAAPPVLTRAEPTPRFRPAFELSR